MKGVDLMQRVEWLKTDLQKPARVLELKTDLFLHDNTGNVIGVEVTDGGEAATITGTVRCYVIRPDTTTVIFEGTVDGNKVTVTLPREVYYFTGRANFLIRVESEGNSMTLCAFTGIVYRDRTDRISDSERVIPSVEEITEAISQMEDVVQEAVAKINDMTASATTLPAGSAPTVVLTLEDGHYHISFGIPQPSVDVIDDTTGAGDYDKTWSANKIVMEVGAKADPSNALQLTLLAADWTADDPPVQTLTATGVTATNNILFSIGASATAEQIKAYSSGKIMCTSQGANQITVTCFDRIPIIDIPVTVVIIG